MHAFVTNPTSSQKPKFLVYVGNSTIKSEARGQLDFIHPPSGGQLESALEWHVQNHKLSVCSSEVPQNVGGIFHPINPHDQLEGRGSAAECDLYIGSAAIRDCSIRAARCRLPWDPLV